MLGLSTEPIHIRINSYQDIKCYFHATAVFHIMRKTLLVSGCKLLKAFWYFNTECPPSRWDSPPTLPKPNENPVIFSIFWKT